MRVTSIVMIVLASVSQICLASQFSAETKQRIEEMSPEEAAYNLMSELINKGDTEAVKEYLNEDGGTLAIKYALTEDSPGTRKDYYVLTPLLQAVLAKNYAIAKMLLEKNDDPNSVNMEHGTPLQCAVRDRDGALIDLLLAHGALNEIGGFDQVALVTAIENRDNDTMLKLMQHGAYVNYGGIPDELNPQYDTPLTMAVKVGDPEVIKFLLANGADINMQAPTFLTPIETAMRSENTRVTKLLLDLGAGKKNNEKSGLLDKEIKAFSEDDVSVPSADIIRLALKYGIKVSKESLRILYEHQDALEQMRLVLGIKTVSGKLLGKGWVREAVGLDSGCADPTYRLLYNAAHGNVEKLCKAIRERDERLVDQLINAMQDIHVYEPEEPKSSVGERLPAASLNTPLHVAVTQYIAHNNAYNRAVSEQKKADEERCKTALAESKKITESLFVAKPQLWDTPNIYDQTPFDILAQKGLVDKFEGIVPKKLNAHYKEYVHILEQEGIPSDVINSCVSAYMGGLSEDDIKSEQDAEHKTRAESSSSRYDLRAVIADSPLRTRKRKATDAPLLDAEVHEPTLKKFKKQ